MAKGFGFGLVGTSVKFGKSREAIRGRGMFGRRRGWLVGDAVGVNESAVFAVGAKITNWADVVTANTAGVFLGILGG